MFDDIFDPDRLREHWKREEKKAPPQPLAAEPVPVGLEEEIRHLGRLVQERFPGPSGEALELLSAELASYLPEWENEEGRKAAAEAMEKILNNIEELAEAIGLRERKA